MLEREEKSRLFQLRAWSLPISCCLLFQPGVVLFMASNDSVTRHKPWCHCQAGVCLHLFYPWMDIFARLRFGWCTRFVIPTILVVLVCFFSIMGFESNLVHGWINVGNKKGDRLSDNKQTIGVDLNHSSSMEQAASAFIAIHKQRHNYVYLFMYL